MIAFDAKIKFTDGEELTLQNVTHYSFNVETKTAIVSFSTGYSALFNLDSVKYIGRALDLYEE